MRYLGSERIVSYPFSDHITAEDYAGNHKSEVSIPSRAKVVRTINRFKSHEDSINYNEFLNNKNNWRDGNYYNCISITGKNVRMHSDELGGNQIWLETYDNNNLITLRLCHLDSVNVKVGDIVEKDQVIGFQGNTGLVLSNKNKSDITYGSHVHLEVINRDGNYLNPRKYANGEITTNYISQSNNRDEAKKQIKILVDKINIREKADQLSLDIGDVFMDEIYTVLDTVDNNYIWYKISTNTGIIGYVASKKDEKWIELLEPVQEKPVSDKDDDKKNSEQKDDYKLIFNCGKEDYYYLKLYKGEKLYIKKD